MTKTALKTKLNNQNIANEEWPGLSELSPGSRFQIHKKAKVANIESLTQTLQNIAVKDDAVIQRNIQKDESFMLKQDTVSKPKAPKAKKVEVAQVVEPVVTSTPKTQMYVERKEEVVARVAPVNPQTTNQTTSLSTSIEETTKTVAKPNSMTTPTVKVAEEKKMSFKALFTFVAKGLTHLYIKKTTTLLKPLGFVVDNFANVLIALMHLTIPVLMTFFLVKKVDFMVAQLANEGAIMSLIYYAIFYSASFFIWIFAQVLCSGLVNMIKKTLEDVAKVGKENR